MLSGRRRCSMSARLPKRQLKSLSHSPTPSFMLSSTVCISARVRSASRLLGGFLRGGESLLALLQVCDVAIDRQHAAVGERLEGEFDETAARGLALVARAGAHDQQALVDRFVDVLQRTEVAALSLEA